MRLGPNAVYTVELTRVVSRDGLAVDHPRRHRALVDAPTLQELPSEYRHVYIEVDGGATRPFVPDGTVRTRSNSGRRGPSGGWSRDVLRSTMGVFGMDYRSRVRGPVDGRMKIDGPGSVGHPAGSYHPGTNGP